MKGPAISVPAIRASAWVVETDPKYARAWLDSLPLANSGDAAREIYQALYTLNRSKLPVDERIELMDLYHKPVATVSNALQGHLMRATPPLSPKKRQLAEFVRRLQMEMAYGYKCSLHDLGSARFRWRRDASLARIAERALYYLREVLIRSYLAYMPYPAGVWKEIHEIYRFAESRRIPAEPIELAAAGANKTITLTERYLQTVLLGLSQPYQLPQNACVQLCAFLDGWGARARLSADLAVANPVGHFVIDLAADAPPLPFPRDGAVAPNEAMRVLNAVDLVHVAHGFIARLKKGEPVTAVALGVDCLEDACLDLLQRMVSVWGLTPRRRFRRIRRNSYVSACSGIAALHFFANDQTPFVPADIAPEDTTSAIDAGFVPQRTMPGISGAPVAAGKTGAARRPSSFRIDRWHVRDAGPQGMLLAKYGEIGMSVRVGDVLGLQEVGGLRWSVAVVRWLKSPETQSLELGVELLAADPTPVAVRGAEHGGYAEALLLPPSTAPRRPASLLVARGVLAVGRSLYLLERGRPPRLIRPLKLIERTTSCERVIFADVTAASA